MANQMTEFKAAAQAHMRDAFEAGGKWVCGCEACRQIRSLTGMDKTLELRPLVREIEDIENRLQGSQDGPEQRVLLERYLKLYDELADVMVR